MAFIGIGTIALQRNDCDRIALSNPGIHHLQKLRRGYKDLVTDGLPAIVKQYAENSGHRDFAV